MIRRLDPQFRLTYMNGAYARAFKLRIGDVMLTAIHPDDAERARTALAELRMRPYRSIVEVRNWIRGEWRWVRWENSAIRDRRGELGEIQGKRMSLLRWPADARTDPVLLDQSQQVLLRAGLINQPVDSRRLYDERLLAEVSKETR